MLALLQQLGELAVARPWEALAILSGIAYVAFAARESVWCWPAALISTAIFACLFWDVSLLMESALNVYYLIMAVYGWWLWTRTGANQPEQKIHSWKPRQHCISIAVILGLSLSSGLLLSTYTHAALPFLDSFTTWGAVVTTFMVARKVLENWLYWLVIDSVSIFIYLDRGMQLTTILLVIYLITSVYGWFSWKKLLHG